MNHKGFTLMELLMVIVIMGILAAIAVPSYQNSVQKSRRTDGKTALSGLQIEMEKFRGNCITYPGNLGNADACGANAGASTIDFSANSNDGYYTIFITQPTANSYTLKAVAVGSQANDTDCPSLFITVDNAHPKGQKTPADCW